MDSQVERNINGYRIVIQIEVGLREYIINSFNIAFPGIDWFSVEHDIIPTKKIENSIIERQRSIDKGWDAESAENIHGMYFLLLTDLKDILFKKYKLNNEAISVFQLNRNKLESICSGLQSVFPIRNKIAHSVYISDIELQALDSYLATLRNLISDFEMLINQPEVRKQNEIKFRELIKKSCKSMLANEMLGREEIKYLINNWVSLSLRRYKSVMLIIEEYSKLSQMTGSSVRLRNLVEDNIEELKKYADDE